MIDESRATGLQDYLLKASVVANGRDRLRAMNAPTVVGIAVIALFIVAAAAASLIAQNPLNGLANTPFSPPSAAHWFGTDENGRDIFARIVYGARYDLMIALGAGGIGTVAGTLIGGLLGFYGGVVDEVAMRCVD